MDPNHDVLRALGRIEGELIGMGLLNERVLTIEANLWWLKGVLAVLLAILGFICHATFSR
jgi:hypothetical protein